MALRTSANLAADVPGIPNIGGLPGQLPRTRRRARAFSMRALVNAVASCATRGLRCSRTTVSNTPSWRIRAGGCCGANCPTAGIAACRLSPLACSNRTARRWKSSLASPRAITFMAFCSARSPLRQRAESLTTTIPRVEAKTVGGLIALFERAVGLHAGLLGINAYHQPGVEAGAAAPIFTLQRKVQGARSQSPQTAEQIATTIGSAESAEAVFLLLERLAANRRARAASADDPGKTTFVRA